MRDVEGRERTEFAKIILMNKKTIINVI